MEEKEIKKEKDDNINLLYNLLKIGKWKKDQVVSLFDLSSLDGVLNSIFKVLTIILIVRLIKGGKNE